MSLGRLRLFAIASSIVVQAIALSLISVGARAFATPGPSFLVFVVPFFLLAWLTRATGIHVSERQLEFLILVLNTVFLYYLFYFVLKLAFRKRLRQLKPR